MRRRTFLSGLAAANVTLAAPGIAFGHGSEAHSNAPAQVLPKMGPAPDFTLSRANGGTRTLSDLTGKVLAVNFIFTRCIDLCPLATWKMVWIQDQFGNAFGRDIHFVSVTVDPGHDTPEVLRTYASDMGSNLAGWDYLTGSQAETDQVARDYGVFAQPTETGDVAHILLTTLIDHRGESRVQYLGERFDPEEMLADLQALTRERAEG